MATSVCTFCFIHEQKWEDEYINRFEVYIPQHDCTEPIPVKVNNYHAYLKLTLDGTSVILKTVQQNKRRCEASIHPSVFEKKDLSGVVYVSASKKQWLRYKEKNIKFVDSGWPPLLVGVAGLVIDTAFTIGKANENLIQWYLSDGEILFWMILSLVLKIIALYLLYRKSVKEAK